MSGRRGEAPGAASPKTAPTWVKVLVGFHVLASLIWALPEPPKAVMEGKESPHATQWLLYWDTKYLKALPPIRSYILTTGAWQYWDMFAPNPSDVDWYCTAELTYRDGSAKTVPYPRMADLPVPLKYVKERYRKFYERAHDDAQPMLWPIFAQAMALRGYDDPKNPPVTVRLRRWAIKIAPPGQPQAKDYDSYVYYTYAVDQGWLRKART